MSKEEGNVKEGIKLFSGELERRSEESLERQGDPLVVPRGEPEIYESSEMRSTKTSSTGTSGSAADKPTSVTSQAKEALAQVKDTLTGKSTTTRADEPETESSIPATAQASTVPAAPIPLAPPSGTTAKENTKPTKAPVAKESVATVPPTEGNAKPTVPIEKEGQTGSSNVTQTRASGAAPTAGARGAGTTSAAGGAAAATGANKAAPATGASGAATGTEASGAGKEVEIAWTYGADREVLVAGSFTGWKPTLKLSPKGNMWATAVKLPPGTHRYKFVVDGEWKYDVTKPNGNDGSGNYNNVVEV